MTNTDALKQSLLEAASVIDELKVNLPAVADVSQALAEAFNSGHKLLACGNGGSAADAQHLTGEWLGRFVKDRRPYPAIALTADSSLLTAVGNDYGFEEIFARQVRGLLSAGDIFVGISTSGNSHNVLQALQAANEMGGVTVSLLGRDGGRMKGAARHEFVIPSSITARIQEGHGLLIHLICEEAERILGHS